VYNPLARSAEPVLYDGYHDIFMLLLTAPFVNRAVGKVLRDRFRATFPAIFVNILFVKSQPTEAL
jgi:hypothetical protein